MNDLVSLEGARFNEAIRHNEGGSIFLGYLYAELTVDGVLDDGDPLKMGMPDMQVRITREGKPRVDFPSDLKEINGEERRVSRYFTASKGTRELLTTLVFSIPAVSRAVEKAERARKTASKHAAA